MAEWFTINKSKMEINSDWLASNTWFINKKTKKLSRNINDVIDYEDFNWDYEGLYNYLDCGYTVFSQTPIKNIVTLPHSSTLKTGAQFRITKTNDVSYKWLGKTTHEDDALHLIGEKVKNWEKSVEGNIVLPISGGFDSRLLALSLSNYKNVKSFTYGLSPNQGLSKEVIHAKYITEQLSIDWRQIEIGKFHRFMRDWYNIYGASTHAHGMYHMEFYTKMMKFISGGNHFLSGLIGDAWAGAVKVEDIKKPSDLVYLSYSHGLRAEPSMLINKNITLNLRDEYFESHKHNLKSHDFRVIEAMRFKMILLNYLIRVPEYFGFKIYAPFLDPEVALSFLTIDKKRRENRTWQVDYFKKNNFYLEGLSLSGTYKNNLNFQAAHQLQLEPLSEKLLGELFDIDYIKWINKYTFQGLKSRVLSKVSVYNRTRRHMFLPHYPFKLKAYCAYLTLYPLQELIKRRNEYFKQ